MLREEARILRSRVAAISARHRPRYPPPERLAILALRAANGWTIAETGRRFMVTVATIAIWMRRLDEGGEGALVAIPEPVNRYPEFVGEIVRRMRSSFPALGKVRIADMLARASLHLAPATTTFRGASSRGSSFAASPTPSRSASSSRSLAEAPAVRRGISSATGVRNFRTCTSRGANVTA